MEFIQVKGVYKAFGKLAVLRDVNLQIEEGELLGIIGQSGSGKTTLLNILSGFIQPSKGNVVYFSKVNHQPKSLHKHFSKIKKHIGFTPQHSALYPKLTVKENLMHFGQLYGMKKKTLIENAKSLLKFTGLYEHRNKKVEQLSGGMKKRLDISCSLIHKPKMLFLDEPTANLDPIMERDIINLIQEVNKQGVTVIIASHHLESIENMCTSLAIIKNGQVHSYGDVEDVRAPFLRENTVFNIKAGTDRERVIDIAKTLPVDKIVDQGHQVVVHASNAPGAIGQLLSQLEQQGMYLHDVDIRKPSLREIFHKVAQEEENQQ